LRLRELAAVRRRFGYRRPRILLRREGIVMNHKKLRRLYSEERMVTNGQAIDNCKYGDAGRKRALGARAPMTIAARSQF
jgi:putative transposase